MPTDPTLTPREVMLAAIARGWCGRRNERKMMDPDLAAGIADEVLAALAATGDAPLAEKRLAELRGIFESSKSIIDEKCGLELLTAYTTLAAQLEALRAERDALRERAASQSRRVQWAVTFMRRSRSMSLEMVTGQP